MLEQSLQEVIAPSHHARYFLFSLFVKCHKSCPSIHVEPHNEVLLVTFRLLCTNHYYLFPDLSITSNRSCNHSSAFGTPILL